MSADLGRRDHGAVVFAAALGVALVVVGAVLAYVGYRRSGGPEGAVRSYYAALASADAPRALAWGATPAGSRLLLTSQVLAEQRRVAPISDVSVGHAARSGSRARVPVTYRLGFATGERVVRQRVTVTEHDGDWRLAATAVPVRFAVDTARDRLRVRGAAVPTDTVLVFPGAAPLEVDSSYLRPSPVAVTFGMPAVVQVQVGVTDTGTAVVTSAVNAALARCVRAGGDATCPLPGTRYVPGSLRGTASLGAVTVSVAGRAGLLDATATATFRGSYRVLTFANRQRSGNGAATLQVHARVSATAPGTVQWQTS